jgi:hypothetical protein
MAFRNLNGKKYPIPGFDTALYTNWPNARWHIVDSIFEIWEDDDGNPCPTWEEIQEVVNEQSEIYGYFAYERDREKEYPELKDQLDMLFKDITSGKLEDGEWYQTIKSIKDKHPKPEDPTPDLSKYN